ncbi:TVP38/TMEM64 family protein [Iodidimonas muriae]|uniref:TVP38/TMEM64 family membrane protein n=1 Tax=Iodidimonas muriae TaxID=261467 RepID=A0ABQ2LAF1_9PROT|nr:TVP38/TMEM64 family protein [Iodidimonas muriae]GER06183.1 TVP38/TMEM64 family protein [Kordiimonadales bacterium JCM 17843]GGO08577.1 TVP38/TMEM64 family protein [Iodidimonas muriae]
MPNSLNSTQDNKKAKGFSVRRILPIVILAAVIAAVYASGVGDYVSFAALSENLDMLQSFVAENTVVALLVLVLFYAVGTAVSLPAMGIVSIASGVIFGLWLGFFGVLMGATLGATAIFLIVRTSLGDALRTKVGPWLGKFESGFQKDAFNYLLALRLVPVFPFWVLNIAPALLGVRLKSYVAATALGIIPGTFVFVWVGKGAAETIRLGNKVDATELLFQPHVIGPLVGLALLSLIPVILRKVRGGRSVGTPINGES